MRLPKYHWGKFGKKKILRINCTRITQRPACSHKKQHHSLCLEHLQGPPASWLCWPSADRQYERPLCPPGFLHMLLGMHMQKKTSGNEYLWLRSKAGIPQMPAIVRFVTLSCEPKIKIKIGSFLFGRRNTASHVKAPESQPQSGSEETNQSTHTTKQKKSAPRTCTQQKMASNPALSTPIKVHVGVSSQTITSMAAITCCMEQKHSGAARTSKSESLQHMHQKCKKKLLLNIIHQLCLVIFWLATIWSIYKNPLLSPFSLFLI